MSSISEYLDEVATIARTLELDHIRIEQCVRLLAQVRERHGRVFVLGNGGSAANAAHAVNDLRKLACIEAYAPSDNIAELTARTNDDGWATTFSRWLQVSHLGADDLVLVLSVGGGEAHVSPNIAPAVAYAHEVGATILGIVGRDGGATATYADICVRIPSFSPKHITAQAENFQIVLIHLFVTMLRLSQTANHESIP